MVTGAKEFLWGEPGIPRIGKKGSLADGDDLLVREGKLAALSEGE